MVFGVTVYQPQTIHDVVWIVQNARDRSIRAIGSTWSFTGALMPDAHKRVLVPDGTEPLMVDLSEITISAHKRMAAPAAMLRAGQTPLVLATAGTRLADLNEYLWTQHLAMPTLGGSQGQRLGGAFGTGVHGSDFDHADLTEVVRAIHLVAPGGKEYWLERTRGVTDEQSFTHYPLYQPGVIERILDDDTFHSALVSCGRFGIQFAFLLEAPPRYFLREKQSRQPWSDIKARLTNAARKHADYRAEFKQPFAHPPSTLSPPTASLRGLIVTLDPYDRANAYVVQRWEIPEADLKLHPDLKHASEKLIAPAQPASIAASLLDQVKQVFNDPVSGAFRLAGLSTAIAAVPLLMPLLPLLPALPLDPLGFATFTVWFAANADAIYAKIASTVFQSLREEHDIVGPSFNVTSGTPLASGQWDDYFDEWQKNFPKVWGLEYFFDAAETGYLDFVEELLRQWGGILAGYLSLRFTNAQSPAMLGLNRFPNGTVAVEIALVIGLRDSQHYKDLVLQTALKYRCIHHWGQDGDELGATAVQALYGDRLTSWRKALERLSEHGKLTTFSNAFTRRLGLELSPGLLFAYRGKLRAFFLAAGPGAILQTQDVSTTGSLRFVYAGHDVLVVGGVALGPVQMGALQASPGMLVIRKGNQLMATVQLGPGLRVALHQ